MIVSCLAAVAVTWALFSILSISKAIAFLEIALRFNLYRLDFSQSSTGRLMLAVTHGIHCLSEQIEYIIISLIYCKTYKNCKTYRPYKSFNMQILRRKNENMIFMKNGFGNNRAYRI